MNNLKQTEFEARLAQAILGALEYRGFNDCGKYIDPDLIEHIRPLLNEYGNTRELAGIEKVERWVNDNTKTFTPADNIWVGKDDYSEGKYQLFPANYPDRAMYCLNCEGFLHEEGCRCELLTKQATLNHIATLKAKLK